MRRELSILSAMFETARKEWGWVRGNPCSDISKLQNKRHRERLISWREVKAMLRAMNYSKRRRVASTTQAVAVCFLAALRTGMRAGELCGLTWDQVYDRHCHLPLTKNGDSRDVPLWSCRADPVYYGHPIVIAGRIVCRFTDGCVKNPRDAFNSQ